jgi:OPA family glycerol-3-phosphate transporter-like MFS transporter
MLDWGPTYLREVKGVTGVQGGDAVMYLEFAGIPSTLLMGWLSDRWGGRRGMVSVLCMIPVTAAFAGILLNPAGNLWLDYTLLGVVGFFVYPPVMMLGVMGLDLTNKKAVGTAAGFIGLFGYLGRTVQAKGFGWLVQHHGAEHGLAAGWNLVLWIVVGCAAMGILLLCFTWKIRPRA